MEEFLNKPLSPEMARMIIAACICFLPGFIIHRHKNPSSPLRESVEAGFATASLPVLAEFLITNIPQFFDFRNGLISFVGNLLY